MIERIVDKLIRKNPKRNVTGVLLMIPLLYFSIPILDGFQDFNAQKGYSHSLCVSQPPLVSEASLGQKLYDFGWNIAKKMYCD